MCGFIGMVLNPETTAPGFGPAPAELEDCARQATSTLTRLAANPIIDGAIASTVSGAEALGRKLVQYTGFRAAARSKSLRSQLKALAQSACDAAEALEAVNGSAEESQAVGITVRLRDLAWRVREDVLAQIPRVRKLAGKSKLSYKTPLLRELWRLDVILANLGRLEVRGRDSSGISVLVGFTDAKTRAEFHQAVTSSSLESELTRRRDQIHDFTSGALLEVPPDCPAAIAPPGGSLAFTHKVAREVGELGQNVSDLRDAISQDQLLHLALDLGTMVDAFGHTRWASNGVVSTPNAHPLSNETDPPQPRGSRPLILAALNGDIDNHADLDRDLRKRTGHGASERITTDAKLIPLAIDAELASTSELTNGDDPVEQALLRAAQSFDGSTAIVSQCSATPGRTYLALRGSGQAIHVGLTDEGFIYASELYGVVERTNRHIQLDGRRGEMFVLDASTCDGTGHSGLSAFDYEGSPTALTDLAIREAEITTRDIDRRGYDHFLLKEVEESPDSVQRTLHGKITADDRVVLGEDSVPVELRKRLAENQVRAMLVVGQGTAAIAGRGVAAIMQRDLNALGIPIRTMLATELSGYRLDSLGPGTLVVAVSQSGTTTDTNRAVDLARDRGAMVLAIVNRRGSDLTTKADGVLYTSDGRDIEMSVASTKAFYCQVVAGALLSLFLADQTGCIDSQTRSKRVAALRRLPELLAKTLKTIAPQVRELTSRHAPCRRHWAVIGSGVANVAAQEVRIKISELCYRSVAVDSLEDKKHIDLSSEPLILVCAAGLQGSALADAVKEIAIFKAHRAAPLVIAAAEASERFEGTASGVIGVPSPDDLVGEILVNTAAGHVVAYWAARAIDDGSKPLRQMRASVEQALGTAITGRSPSTSGRWSSNETEAPWLKPARAALLPQLRRLDEGLTNQRYRAAMEPDTAVRLSLLLRYALGRLPLVDLEVDTGIRGSMRDVFEALHATLTMAIEETRRTIDAVKHQAKTVTVGTTRAEEPVTGVLGEELEAAGVPLDVMAPRDLAALHALAPMIETVEGSTLYEISDLDALGRPQDQSCLKVKAKRGVAANMSSRADSGAPLSGTKRLAVRDRGLFLGVGTHDNRPLAILPLLERGVPTGLLLLHVKIVDEAPRDAMLRALLTLGTRYDDLRQAVAERNVTWDDRLLDELTPPDALLDPVERLATLIASSAVGSRRST